MTNDDTTTWQEIWKFIDGRRDLLGISWRKFEKLSNVSQRTFYKMRDDGTPLKSSTKRASLARALGLTPDSIDRLERGEAPITVHSLPDDPPDVYDLRVQIAEIDQEAVAVFDRLPEGRLSVEGGKWDHPEAAAELERLTERTAPLRAQIEILRGEVPLPTGFGKVDTLTQRVAALEARVRSQAQDIAYLLDRARQDDLDAPLAADEPTGDEPRPGSTGA